MLEGWAEGGGTVNERHAPAETGPERPAAALLTRKQRGAIRSLAARFGSRVDWSGVALGGAGLPEGWALCRVGPIVVGVSPEGDVHS